LGLGALAVRARKVTANMTNAASKTLAARVTSEEFAQGLLFPSVTRLADVTFDVALAVAREAVREGVATMADDAIEREIRATMWKPDYPFFAPA
jgi:malate dehydrogenase (oxaloacetate-decarboxylating)